MSEVTFIDFHGTPRKVEGEDGESLMQVALNHLVPGIDGDCGGAAACATCHIYVEAPWQDKLPAMDAQERSMLDLAAGCDERSRLACQLRLNAALSGIVVRTPEAQH